MANSKTPKSEADMTYQDFLDSLETAKDLYGRLIEKTPYLTFIEYAYDDSRIFVLSHKAFREFLKKAGLLTRDNWHKNRDFILPAAARVNEFNVLTADILDAISELNADTVDYESIKRTVVRGPLRTQAKEWFKRLRSVFNYFDEYKSYLEDAIVSSEIANIANEAKKNLEATEDITKKQKQMLEESGGLARAGVYYELAYGANVEDGKGTRRRMGHRESAALWLYGVLLSIVATALAAAFLFTVMDIDFSRPTFEVITLIVLKALILLPLFYLIRFCVHTYRVNKHLEVVYAHRWALHETLAQYLKTGESNGKESSLRMGQLEQITPFFYSEIETGFITKKDGLGDKSIEVVPEELLKSLKINVK